MIIPAEISVGGVLIPRFMICGVSGFLFACLIITLLRHRGWSRFIWHLPVFFLAIWAIFTFLLELILLSA
jgi:uncharacterized ion transporter superfamily protein YfcC